jgi:hypothetical protein
MPAHPNFRTIVFEKKRTLRPPRGDDSCPAKSRITLINKIRIGALDQRHSAAREHEVVVNIKQRSRSSAGLRRYNRETIFCDVQPGNKIIADDMHVNSKRLEPFDNSLDVTCRAARLRAGTGSGPKVNHTQSRVICFGHRRICKSQCLFFESLQLAT